MSIQQYGHTATSETTDRPLWRSMMRGMAGRCPACGKGKLFSHGLTIADSCDACGEELHHHRADDLPAYLNIFIVGHITVAAAMIAMDWTELGTWTIVGLTCAAALVSAVALMRPLKGLVVGAQWALRMHGFGGHDD